MSSHKKKLLLVLSGKTGSTLLSMVALWVTLSIAGLTDHVVYEMLVSVVLVRIIYRLTRGPKPVLAVYSVCKRAWRVFVDELIMGIIFVAIIYAMHWPVDRTSVGVYLGANLVLQMSMLLIVRLVLSVLMRAAKRSGDLSLKKQAIVVGTGKRARAVADMILDSPELETLLIGFLDYHRTGLWRYRDVPLIGRPDLLSEIIATCQVDALFIAVEAGDMPRTKSMFRIAEQMGVTICLMPEIYDPQLARVRPTYLNGLPTFVYRAVPENQFSLLVKNVLDRVSAVVGLVCAAPLMLVTALLIKLESKGPVFFTQIRSGLNGKVFKMYKFRTMCYDAEEKKESLNSLNEMSGPVFKITNDPRITRVGRVLRKLSIDEVPQFINVLRGEMSLVGPRPPLPKEVARYEPWQHRKLSVKPGVTCLWQVNGRNGIDFDKWMRLDLQYIDNWSLWLDAKIIAKTIPAVIKSSGAS